MASVKATLPFIAARQPVREAIARLNERLRRDLGRREFVALAMARFDPSTGGVEIANAGLPDPYVLSAAGCRAIEVPGDRLPLGLKGDADHRTTHLRLAAGERLLMLSDGLPEAEIEGGEPLGYETFEAILGSTPAAADPEEWLDGLLAGCRHATVPLLRDDWTALLLQPATAPGKDACSSS